jgi:hypothetical protein
MKLIILSILVIATLGFDFGGGLDQIKENLPQVEEMLKDQDIDINNEDLGELLDTVDTLLSNEDVKNKLEDKIEDIIEDEDSEIFENIFGGDGDGDNGPDLADIFGAGLDMTEMENLEEEI